MNTKTIRFVLFNYDNSIVICLEGEEKKIEYSLILNMQGTFIARKNYRISYSAYNVWCDIMYSNITIWEVLKDNKIYHSINPFCIP